MANKLLRSKALRTALVCFVLLASAFALMVSTQYASAQSSRTNLVVGLQNDMQNVNFFDPATNSVWKAYQVQYNFETLLTFDPNYQVYADLADPSRTCPTGTVVSGPGYCFTDASLLNVTVFVRPNVSFTDGQPMTSADVVFTYQTLAWSTFALSDLNAIWWDNPKVPFGGAGAPLWNSTAYGGACPATSSRCLSHIAVKAVDATTVQFQLTPHTVPGVTNGGYSLVLFDTLNVPIIPEHVWKNHLQTSAQLNYSSPTLAPITDTWDQSISFAYGATFAQADASIGTGPFMLASWVHNSGSKEVVYPGYWGKGQSHVWQGVSYPYFPKYLTEIDFIIFGSLDVVSLALQQGTIDTLLWSLTPGFVNVVSTNPAITVQTVTDSGYFYLSFNLRKAPWNQYPLRKAISQAIDKNYIVNTLMGGFGIAGTVPIGIANPTYVNTSAAPPSFDLAGAVATLKNAGYTIDPNTGFFVDPSGNPISATILTPPKDYDPVRADAGIMISNNLKSIGLDIEAAPTSFDTIVARAFTPPVNFDIYILGWSLGLFPESYLCSFFCSDQDVNINAAGQNSAGYHNPTVDGLINQALYTADTPTRVNIVKHIEGLVTNDIPWNVLYYRKNVVAWRNDAWTGWVLYPNPNAQFNFYSLVNIAPAGTLIPPSGTSGSLTVASSIPDQVFYRENVPIDVYVSQGGAPANGAAVSVNISFGVGSFSKTFTGTTDATGHFGASWSVPLIQGSGVVTTTATLGTSTGTNVKVMESTIGPPMPEAQLRLNSSTPVITGTQHAVITATATDAAGNPVSGLTVTIDKNVTLGSVAPLTGTTNAAGQVLFTYTPPSPVNYTNAQLTDLVRAKISVPNTIAPETQAASMYIVTQNDAPPSWDIVSLDPFLATFTLSNGTPSLTYKVNVTNFQGNPVSGAVVEALYSDPWNITVTPATATTVSGQATFTVAATARALTTDFNTTTIPVSFQVKGALNTTSDEILVFLAKGTVLNSGVGGYISFASRAVAYNAAGASDSVTVHLFDQNGLPASGVPAMFKIDYGDFGLPAQFAFGINYYCNADGSVCWVGYTSPNGNLDLNSFGQGSLGGSFANSTPTDGSWNYGVTNFVNDFEVVGWSPNSAPSINNWLDACDPTGRVWGVGAAPNPSWDGSYIINVTSVTGVAGTYTLSFDTAQEPVDSRIQVMAFVGASGGAPFVSANACAFTASLNNFAAHFSSGIVTQRAPIFALSSVTPSAPIVTSLANSVKFSAEFKDVNGPVSSADVLLTQGAGSAARNVLGAFGGPLTTNGAGWLNYTRTVKLSLSQGLTLTYLPTDSRYAFSAHDQLFFDAFGPYWFAPTFEYLLAKLPMSFTIGFLYLPTTKAFLTVQSSTGLTSVGGVVQETVTVYSALTGKTISGANVWLGNLQETTNATGVAVFSVTALQLGATEGLVVASTAYGGIARGWFGFMASLPVLSYSNLAVAAQQAGSASTINVSVQNTLAVSGNQTVWLIVDNKTVAGKVVYFAPNQNQVVSFTYVFATSGPHQVSIGGQSANVNIAAVPPVDLTAAYALAAGLLVAGLVVGVVVGLLLGRRRKGPPAAMSSEPSGAAPKSAEEELGPDENL